MSNDCQACSCDPTAAPATTFESGDAVAYVLPRMIAVAAEPLPVDVVAAIVAGDATAQDVARAASADVAIVHHADAGCVDAIVVGDRLVALVDGHRVGGSDCQTESVRRQRFERASLIRLGRADDLGGEHLPFTVDVGVVPASVIERRLEPPPPDADPVVAFFGTTVNRPIESAAVRERLVRPDTAVLIGDDGRRISLDRPVLLGRHPNPDPAQATARVVSIDRPDVSRRHASVTTDRWSVVAVDLGSVNGTTVELPGCRPERLQPGRRQPLVPGAVLRLGSDCSFTLEQAA